MAKGVLDKIRNNPISGFRAAVRRPWNRRFCMLTKTASFIGLVLFSGFLLTANGSTAQAATRQAAAPGSCPAFDAPIIKVSPMMEPAREDYSRSIATLTSKKERSGRWRTVGLYESSITYRIALSWTIFTTGTTTCLGLHSAEIDVGFSRSVLSVARELPRGSCIFREAYDHEMRHRKADIDLLNADFPKIQRIITEAARNLPTGRTSDEKSSADMLGKRLGAVVKTTVSQLERRRETIQSKIDSTEEYARLAQACGGELPKLLVANKIK